MLKRIDTNSRFQIIGKAIQSFRSYMDKLWIPSFVSQKGNFNILLKEGVITLFSTTGQKSLSK